VVTTLKINLTRVQYTNSATFYIGVEMAKKNKLLITWCWTCANKRPPNMEKAVFWVPIREQPYGLSSDGFSIDKRVKGVCEGCLGERTNFQIASKQLIVDNDFAESKSL
jgi:hypothetical protein